MGDLFESVPLAIGHDQVQAMMSDARFFDILGSLERAQASTLTSRQGGVVWTRTISVGLVEVSVEDAYEWAEPTSGTFTSAVVGAPMGISGSLSAEMIVEGHDQESRWILRGRYSVALPLMLRSYEALIAQGLRDSLQLRAKASLAWRQFAA